MTTLQSQGAAAKAAARTLSTAGTAFPGAVAAVSAAKAKAYIHKRNNGGIPQINRLSHYRFRSNHMFKILKNLCSDSIIHDLFPP